MTAFDVQTATRSYQRELRIARDILEDLSMGTASNPANVRRLQSAIAALERAIARSREADGYVRAQWIAARADHDKGERR